MSPKEPAGNPAQLHSILDQNLTFTLGSEEFGIQVLHIRDTGLTPIAPPPIPGLVHLGAQPSGQACGQTCTLPTGPLIPVADLSLSFDFHPRAYADRTCIVVVRTQPTSPTGAKERLLAALTGAPETLDIPSDDIELTPDFGDGAPLPYLLGMARVHGTVKLLQHPIHALLKLTGDS